MKKYLIIILIVLGFGAVSFAQMSKNQPAGEAVSIGLKGGLNMPRMLYFNNEALSQLPQAFTFTPMGGLFFDIPMGNLFVLSPEFVYLKRGTDISYEHFSGAKVHYSMSVHFVDFRLPLELRWPIKPYFQPYLMVGAEGGVRLGGQIHIDRTAPIVLDQTIDVGDANMSLIHAGAFAGVGIRSRIGLGCRHILLKLSASAHQGLLDNYGTAEKEGSVPAVNVNAYQVTGWRLSQGLEVCLGIAIPLEKRVEDACSTFANDRYRRHGKGRHLFGY